MSSNEPVILLENVGKLFRKQKQLTAKEMFSAVITGKQTSDSFWALKNVNLTVNRGETIGVLGPNGAGKSTLLKVIAGVSKITEGKITVRGKIAPLIELGAGFHPELSGKENIFLNGIILGMKKSQVQEKMETIVQFAELEEFLDVPIKHYSSGMYLRLAFAVAIHTEPEILLVDEILAVGDERFRKKCFRKWDELKSQGVTSVLISHDTRQIERFCDRVVFLQNGELKNMPTIEAAIQEYKSL